MKNRKLFNKLIAYLSQPYTIHVLFLYKGEECAIDTVSSYVFNMWYGQKAELERINLKQVRTEKIFDGKSLEEIFDEVADTIEWP